MADVGDEIRKFIQEIAGATVADKEGTAELAANISDARKAKDTQLTTITAQIELLTDTIALLAQSLANNIKHSSNTCTHKKDGYKNKATATNCMGGDNFWPRINQVKPSQQEHARYKGKSAPN